MARSYVLASRTGGAVSRRRNMWMGLGYLELLAQSALGVAVVLGIFLLVVTFVFAAVLGLAVALIKGTSSWRYETAPPVVVRGCALVLVGAAVAVTVLAGPRAGAIAIEVALLAFAASAIGLVRRRLKASVPRPDDITVQWLLWNALPVMVMLSLPLGALTLVGSADSASREARAGRASSTTWWGVRMLSWRADAATLTWTGDVEPGLAPLAGRCVVSWASPAAP